MQIEEGKFYRTRSGVLAGPMTRPARIDHVFRWRDPVGILYRDDGGYNESNAEHPRDLIMEVTPVKEPMAIGCGFYVKPEDAPAIAPTDPAYATLAGILQAAHDQAAIGKGHDRHSGDKPFLEQPIMEIARMLGDTGGHAYQIMKKAQEANRMVKREQYDAAVHEFLGVINYAAAAVLLIREL